VNNAPADNDRSATSTCLTVRPSANIVREPEGPVRLYIRIVQEVYVDAVFAEELIQFQFSAANPVSIPVSQSEGFSQFALLGRAVIFSYKENNRF
jgi:hypothetical protein